MIRGVALGLAVAVAVVGLGLGACERDVILDPRDAGDSDGGFVGDAFPAPDGGADLDAAGFDGVPPPDGVADAP